MLTRFLKEIAVVLLTINFLACATLSPVATPAAVDIEREEQAVYSFFLNEGDGPALILQETSTTISTDDPRQTLDYIKEGLPSLSDQTLDNFVERNAQPGQLSPTMNIGVDYVLLTSDELSEITSQPNWGEVLTEKYPGSYGYTIFSRVGFNNTLDQAVIYVGSMAGPLVGSGSYFLMEKKNGEWLMLEQIMAWIS